MVTSSIDSTIIIVSAVLPIVGVVGAIALIAALTYAVTKSKHHRSRKRILPEKDKPIENVNTPEDTNTDLEEGDSTLQVQPRDEQLEPNVAGKMSADTLVAK